jgi:hypothetical protein
VEGFGEVVVSPVVVEEDSSTDSGSKHSSSRCGYRVEVNLKVVA